MTDYKEILHNVQNERLNEIEVYNRAVSVGDGDPKEAAAILRAIYLYRKDIKEANLAHYVEEIYDERKKG